MTDWTCPEDVPDTTVEHLHRWLRSGNPADAATPAERAVADVIHAFWPAPEPTLAEDIRAWAEKRYTAGGNTGKHELLALAARVEEMGHALATARAEVERLTEECATLTRNRDEPQREDDWLAGMKEAARYTVNAVTPDPADVKPGEAWIVEVRGVQTVAVRPDGGSLRPWVMAEFINGTCWCSDSNITLVSRLVPAPRVITDPEELDGLEDETVLRGENGFIYQRDNDHWITPGSSMDLDSEYVAARLPVTVLWEAGE